MNLGDCHFCHTPVLAGEGQQVLWVKMVGKSRRTGEYVDTIERPTHKACRKASPYNKKKFTKIV